MADPVARTNIVDADLYRIHTLALGPMDNLVYVIEEKAHGCATVVDPAWDAQAIMQLLDERGLHLTDILITHGHNDHVNALGALADRVRAAVHVSAREAEFWRAATSGAMDVGPPPDRCAEVWWAPPPRHPALHDAETVITVGDLSIEILMTPGHSPGGCCYRLSNDLFTGDTLFVYGCGRCDLAGSNPGIMFRSLRKLAERIEDPVIVHPGHRYAAAASTTMAEQRRGNPFLHVDDEDAFVAFRAEHNRHRLPPYGPVLRGQPPW